MLNRKSRLGRFVLCSGLAFLGLCVLVALLPPSHVYDAAPWRASLAASVGSTTRGPLPVQVGSLIVRNVRLPKRLAPISLRIEAGRIVRIAELSEDLGAGLPVLDAGGRFAIPGLIDAHVHLSMAPGAMLRNDKAEETARLRAWHLRAYLASGVTTILDPAVDDKVTLDVRAQLAQGHPGPRFLALGPPFSIKDGYLADLFPPGFSEPGQVPAHLDRLVAMKADGVKVPLESGWAFNILKLPSAELLGAIKSGASVRGLPLYVHAQRDEMYKRGLAELSPHAFVHVPDSLSEDTLAALVRSQAFVVSTLALFNAHPVLFHPELLDDPQARLVVPPIERDTVTNPQAQRRFLVDYFGLATPFLPGRWRDLVAALALSRLGERNFDRMNAERLAHTASVLLRMHRAGVPLVLGSDSGNVPIFPFYFHGLGTWREVILLEQAGLSPAETLDAATTNAARMLGLTAELGALEVGRRADLDILDADPSLGLSRALPTLRWVVHDGIAHTPAEWMGL